MKLNKKYILVLSFILCSCLLSFTKERPVDLANPLIDTKNPRFDYFKSATHPFGMVSLSPDTKHGELWNSGYRYDDMYIINFSHVHNAQTAGISVMPITGECRGNEGLETHKSRFNHNNEIVKLGYHKVLLERYNITTELSATERVGIHRYTFNDSTDGHILFDLGAHIGPTKVSYAYAKMANYNQIEGYSIMEPTTRRKKPFIVYFIAKFDKDFDSFSGWKKEDSENDALMLNSDNNIIEGIGSGAYVTYNNLKAGEQILLKVAISFVSIPNAQMNMKEELNHWDFDKVVYEAQDAWNKYLSRIQVTGGSKEQKIKLYTDLMHTASKSIASDVDGSYSDWTGPYPIIRKTPSNKYGKPERPFIDGDGLWGSQWNLNILWSLIYPEYGNWMAETFLDYYRNANIMSRTSWGGNYSYVMIGDHITPLLASLASTKRATFDLEVAYKAARKNAFVGGIRDRAGYEYGPNPAGGGLDWYIQLGYIPIEINSRGDGYHRGGAAMTLEYSFQDWCLSIMANLTHNPADYKIFKKRSENWKNIFDSEIGWVRPKHINGEWIDNFSPIVTTGNKFNSPGFVESNSAIYSFFVPQDIKGLINAMGGYNSFASKLESSFIKTEPDRFVTPHGEHGTVWIDYENQPSCHMAHLFSYANAPWKTQYWVKKVKDLSFGGTDPYSGYNGDEDQGQMGALGVLMAIGLFDVQGCVGENPQLEITTPIFDKVTLKFPGLETDDIRTFEIITNRNSADDIYIQRAKLNGKEWNSFQFPFSEFLKGGNLELDLGLEPNKKWGLE